MQSPSEQRSRESAVSLSLSIGCPWVKRPAPPHVMIAGLTGGDSNSSHVTRASSSLAFLQRPKRGFRLLSAHRP